MLYDFLTKYNIILGSSSPRREELLTDLGVKFTINDKNNNIKENMKIEVEQANRKSTEFIADLEKQLKDTKNETDKVVKAEIKIEKNLEEFFQNLIFLLLFGVLQLLLNLP